MTRVFGPAILIAFATAGLAQASPVLGEPKSADPASYKTTIVASGLDHPWSLAFLPDGSMLVTERSGALRVIRDGKLVEAAVTGVPAVYAEGQGGLLDVVLDPNFATNSLIYLSYSEGTDEANATAVARARFDGAALQDVTRIYRVSPDKEAGGHFGGRLAFMADGTLLLTTGDGFEYREQAQDKASGLGKIVRITTDGKIPADNPFVNEAGARPEVWSYGHRNVQGLAIDAATGIVYQTEHGALSGDEANIIVKGGNYGWPIATYSVDYSGAVISPFTDKEGTIQPIAVWKPVQLAPSGLAVYRGALFPSWDGDLLVGALAERQVRRLDLTADGKIAGEEKLFSELKKRIRDVRVGPDGAVYLVTDEEDGEVIRVDPAN
jgi:glucose/arabinose dehydrogenase